MLQKSVLHFLYSMSFHIPFAQAMVKPAGGVGIITCVKVGAVNQWEMGVGGGGECVPFCWGRETN